MNVKNGITRRWLISNLGVGAAAMLIVELVFVFFIRGCYYSSAKQYVSSKLGSAADMLSQYSYEGTEDLSQQLRGTLENFSDKDRIELMAVDVNGDISGTSSGFPADSSGQPMPDYEEALHSEDGMGYFMGSSPSGESILAVSRDLTSLGTDCSALRAVVSLEEVDSAVARYIMALTVFCVLIVAAFGAAGYYFINSIVRPVSQISVTAEKFAKGDFSERITSHSSDEIGELCTAINHMADELSNADAMKNEFMSSVSHELRTPLTAIKGWADTIIDEQDGVIVHRGIQVISNETERLQQMVEELLDFSRMQSGHFSLSFANMDILAELGEAVLIYAEKARHDNITVTYEEPQMLPTVYGDKNRIRQVFINVIDNAIKYSEKGGEVEIAAGLAPTGDIAVTVKDSGCGIKKEDLPKIKTKFYKANMTKKGSGIGLAVADEIVTMHGGTIAIESEWGKGTKVTVMIPTASKSRRKQLEKGK